MKHFLMAEEITPGLTDRLLNFLNENQKEIQITMDTIGGGQAYSRLIANAINNYPGKCRINVIAAYSGGFSILMETKCEKFLVRDCIGMWHYPSISIKWEANGEPSYSEDVALLNHMKAKKIDSEKLAKSVMTLEEFKKFKNNKDVYFSFSRMKEIFPNAKII